jgi:uncharacterized membrane protein
MLRSIIGEIIESAVDDKSLIFELTAAQIFCLIILSIKDCHINL